MVIPKFIMKASDALHKVELSMEVKYASVANSVLNRNIGSRLLDAIHNFDLAIIKGVDNFVQSLVHRHDK